MMTQSFQIALRCCSGFLSGQRLMCNTLASAGIAVIGAWLRISGASATSLSLTGTGQISTVTGNGRARRCNVVWPLNKSPSR